jgi:hypothetical protein
MKKSFLTLAFAFLAVGAFAQEKPQDAKKHVCTEQCDHGKKETAHAEGKSCCADAKAGEAKSCDHGKKETAHAEGKSCCADAKAGEAKSCDHGKKETAHAEGKSCCADAKAGEASAKKSCCSETSESKEACTGKH